jgi:sec-independent protein translocase protein TatA
MGLGGISIWQLLIVLGIVVVIFGTGKLRSIGGDLGGAIKSFRKAMNDGESAGGSDDTDDEKKPAPKLEADPEPAKGAANASAERSEQRTDSAS